MKCFFDTCQDAVDFASESKTFGAYYSEKQDPNLKIHIHECCELLLCVSGGKSFLIDDRVYEVKDRDLFAINQFEAHKITPSPDLSFSRYIIHVHPTFLYSNSDPNTNLADCFFRDDGSQNRISLTQDEFDSLVPLFLELDKSQEYGDDIYKKVAAIKLLLTVNKLFSTHSDRISSSNRHRTVQLAIDYINKNYSQDLTLDTIAKNSFVSVNQLCRLFNRYCSTTVSKYIISKRITEAKKLLAEGKSVTETAFICGFNDYANFIRVFKKVVGTPPGKYKNNVVS